MKAKAQVNGTMTIIKSSKMNPELRQKILENGPNGEVRVFKKVLLDPETNDEIVIKGFARSSEKGSLTCRINFKLNNIESLLVEKDEKSKDSKVDNDELARSLGIE